MRVEIIMQLKDNVFEYIHYLIIVLAISISVYIGYTKFVYEKPVVQNIVVYESRDTTAVENLPDSLFWVQPNLESIPNYKDLQSKNQHLGSSSSSSIESKDSNVSSKTWMELFIDLIETLTPLLLPIISYYFKPSSKTEN